MADLPKIERGVTGLRWLKKRRRLLKGGDGVTVTRMADGVVRTAWGFAPSDVLAAVERHNAAAVSERFVKTDVKRRITRVELDGRSLIVKEYMHLHKMLVFSPDMKGWLGSQRLPFAAHCLGWYRRTDASRAWLVFEDVGDGDLYRPRVDSPEAVELVLKRARWAADLIAAMHNKGIFHADTKPGNFVSRGQEPSVTLIDCDDVRVYGHLSLKRRLKNVAQFLGCLWRVEDTGVRRQMIQAFLAEYAEKTGMTVQQLTVNCRPTLMRYIRKLYPARVGAMDGMI